MGIEGEARRAVLANVRSAQIRALIPETKAGLPERLAYAAFDKVALRAKLVKEFALLGVEVFEEASDEEVRHRIKSLIAEKSVLSWDAPYLPYGIGDCLPGESVYFGGHSKDEQGAAEIGLTGCDAALAETGTLAMVCGPGRPRTASLLPFVHVVVIRAADIVLGMGEFLEKFKAEKPLPYLTFITGPSRTADIELSLTLGVHGPGKVIAVMGP
jgi:L-lactate dehydrogenase complex protein LldG